jgi:hypothetical protein
MSRNRFESILLDASSEIDATYMVEQFVMEFFKLHRHFNCDGFCWSQYR